MQLLEGIVYLEEASIAHRDIKPDNILVMERTSDAISVKLADFGVSKLMESSLMGTFCGTSGYLAPEMRQGRTYTAAIDIWSLGVVIFERLCGFPDGQILSRRGRDAFTRAILRRLEGFLGSGRLAGLLDFLSDFMLVTEPHLRQPAEVCLEALKRLPDGDKIQHPVPSPGSRVVVDGGCGSESGDAGSPYTAVSEAASTAALGHVPDDEGREESRDGAPSASVAAGVIMAANAAFNNDIGCYQPSIGKGYFELEGDPGRESAASPPYFAPSMSDCGSLPGGQNESVDEADDRDGSTVAKR